MKELLHHLVRDTLCYLKDPLHPKQALLVSKEELITCTPQRAALAPQKQTGAPSAPLAIEKPCPPIILPQLATKAVEIPIKAPAAVKKEPLTPPLLKETLAKLVPHLRLIDQIPDDTEGKKRASAWKEKITDADVILLACKQDEKTIEFLKTLAKAINERLAKTKIIPAERLEKEKLWDLFLQKNTFRLIIASEGLEQLQDLMRFYRKEPSQNKAFLEKIPLCPLLPSETYKQLEKKALLWKTLCQMLKS